MSAEIFFLVIVVAVWGIVSYYFWFRWRKTKLRVVEESIRLELKHSVPGPSLQLKKDVVYLDQHQLVREAVENMEHPKKLGRRRGDPQNGIGSVVVVGQALPEKTLMPQNIVGIITLKDIIKGCYEQCHEDKTLLDRKCAEVMSQDYMITNEETIRDDCWQVLLAARNRGIEHILIEKDHQIQGIVTDKDIFRAIEFEPR